MQCLRQVAFKTKMCSLFGDKNVYGHRCVILTHNSVLFSQPDIVKYRDNAHYSTRHTDLVE